jgi:hypothetical protein
MIKDDRVCESPEAGRQAVPGKTTLAARRERGSVVAKRLVERCGAERRSPSLVWPRSRPMVEASAALRPSSTRRPLHGNACTPAAEHKNPVAALQAYLNAHRVERISAVARSELTLACRQRYWTVSALHASLLVAQRRSRLLSPCQDGLHRLLPRSVYADMPFQTVSGESPEPI